jgi:hypothetical protein
MKKFASIGRYVTEVHLSSNTQQLQNFPLSEDDDGTQLLPEYSPGNFPISSDQFHQLVMACPQLAKLTTPFTITKKDIPVINSLIHLQDLNLQPYVSFNCSTTATQLDASALQLPNLRSLDLSNRSTTDIELLCILKQCPQLIAVNLQKSRITDASLYSIAKTYQNFEYLSLALCKGITDSGVAALASVKQLRILDVSSCKITAQSIASLYKLQQLRVYHSIDTIAKTTQAQFAPGQLIRAGFTNKVPPVCSMNKQKIIWDATR